MSQDNFATTAPADPSAGADGDAAVGSDAAVMVPSTGRDPTRGTWFYKFMRGIVRGIGNVGFYLETYGLERVPPTGGLLMLSNHQSYLDPPLLGARIDRPLAFLAKSELFHFKPFGRMISNLNAFPVRQGKGDVGAMKEAIRLLQTGWMLNVFPEGGRSPNGQLQPAQKGSGLIVKRAGVPVLPAVIDGAFEAWPRGGKPRPHPVRVLYGSPADIGHLKADDIRKWIDDHFARMLDDLRAGRV